MKKPPGAEAPGGFDVFIDRSLKRRSWWSWWEGSPAPCS